MEDNEKKVKMVEIELDLDEKTHTRLIEYAKEHIIHDEAALINWAANNAFEEIIETDGKCLGEPEEVPDRSVPLLLPQYLTEGYTPPCPKCGGKVHHKFWIFGEDGCTQPDCEYYYKEKENGKSKS
jgi:hypothetical protein